MKKKTNKKWYKRFGSFLRRQTIRSMDTLADTFRSVIYDRLPFTPFLKHGEDSLEDLSGMFELRENPLEHILGEPITDKVLKLLGEEQDQMLEFVMQEKADQRKRDLAKKKKLKQEEQIIESIKEFENDPKIKRLADAKRRRELEYKKKRKRKR